MYIDIFLCTTTLFLTEMSFSQQTYDVDIIGDSDSGTNEQVAPTAASTVLTTTSCLLTNINVKRDIPTTNGASILSDTFGIEGVVDPIIGIVTESSSSAKMHSKSPTYSESFILNLVKAIRSSLEEEFTASIDWENVRQKLITMEENQRAISASECRILWKRVAYGENFVDEDSDEECYFDFPMKVLDCRAPEFSGSPSFALTAQLRSEKRLLQEAKKIKFLVPDKIYDADAHLVAPTFSSSNAHCLSRDLQLPLRRLSWTALQGNPAYTDLKRRKVSESNDGTVGLFAELAAGRSSAAARWTQGQVRSMPLYKSKTVGSGSTGGMTATTAPLQRAAVNPTAALTLTAQKTLQTMDSVFKAENTAK